MASAEPVLAFRSLYESPLVVARDFACRARCESPGGEEESGADGIVLLRRGAFRRHVGRRSVTSDANQATFFSKGSTCRVSHPGGHGDRGTLLRTTPRVLGDIMSELDPSWEARDGRTFPFMTGPCDAALHAQHREVVLRLEAAPRDPLEPTWAEAAILQLMADALAAAHARHGLLRARGPRRRDTDADHADMVEAARTYLAAHLGDRVTLADVAAAAHASPFHLARIFQAREGVPLHRYLVRLRLRTALDRLADARDEADLAELAHALGFSSHAHFTGAFRRETGMAPSSFRRKARAAVIRQVRKNLEA